MLAALLNGLIWLTPPPVHFIAFFMPFFSGYSIASDRPVKGLWASMEIGLIMGLTLSSTIIVIGIVAIAVISFVLGGNTDTYKVVAVVVALAIGSYTAIAACIGAVLAVHRRPKPMREASS
jgi:hypothetical protein